MAPAVSGQKGDIPELHIAGLPFGIRAVGACFQACGLKSNRTYCGTGDSDREGRKAIATDFVGARCDSDHTSGDRSAVVCRAAVVVGHPHGAGRGLGNSKRWERIMFWFFGQLVDRQFSPEDRLPYVEAPSGEQAIELSDLEIQVKVSGLLAETTQTMRFYNPNDRVLEGNL